MTIEDDADRPLVWVWTGQCEFLPGRSAFPEGSRPRSSGRRRVSWSVMRRGTGVTTWCAVSTNALRYIGRGPPRSVAGAACGTERETRRKAAELLTANGADPLAETGAAVFAVLKYPGVSIPNQPHYALPHGSANSSERPVDRTDPGHRFENLDTHRDSARLLAVLRRGLRQGPSAGGGRSVA